MIHQEHDTLFGGKMPAPSAELLHLLRTWVMDNGYDMGLATDGDADRLDAIAQSFGQQCVEVPVGFKHISAGMARYGAILGGESSGGLTVAGHIQGKDGVYAAFLLVEMVAVTGKKLSQLMQLIRKEYGSCYMEENAYTFAPDRKEGLQTRLFTHKELPDFGNVKVEKVSYMDGCKVYFENGGWVVIRFSGTEPLLRVFCEMPTKRTAAMVFPWRLFVSGKYFFVILRLFSVILSERSESKDLLRSSCHGILGAGFILPGCFPRWPGPWRRTW